MSGGIGVVRILADEPDARFDARGSDIGYNLGGCAIGFFNQTVGLRGDVRYFRNTRRDDLISSRSTHHDAIRYGRLDSFARPWASSSSSSKPPRLPVRLVVFPAAL